MTKKYASVGIVDAWPAEMNDKPGYNVKNSQSNIIWVPAEVFEREYVELEQLDQYPDFLQRAIAEQTVLEHRIKKLDTFLNELDDPMIDTELLQKQLQTMRELNEILFERIVRLKL